jgi:hypothetical protein
MSKQHSLARVLAVAIVFVSFSFGALVSFGQTPTAKAPQTQTAGETMHKAMEKPTASTPSEVTLTGEVIDMYCYMSHPATGRGPDHASCAQTCMRKGLPIGFLSGGQVYVLIGKDHESVKDLVVDLAGVQSKLTGKLMDHDGVKAIELIKIEKVASKS